ncbi:MAG: septum formation protein Maf [Clostridia bacterium]|nr:septum formation protein Maf [Clostridia bacterium]
METFLLASASPRRQDILNQLGLPFEVHPSDVCEDIPANTSPEDAVRILACRKAAACAEAFSGRWIIAADTLVVHNGRLLGKPADRDDARSMLRALSGNTHRVLTGVCLRCGDSVFSGTAATEVTFRELSCADINAYIDRGLSYGKAGAYGIQDLGAYFVTHICGDYSNIVGLPVNLLTELLCAAGFNISQLISKGE